MTIHTLTAFFKWCSIINITLLIVSGLVFMVFPGFYYGVHGTMFDLPQEGFNTIFYGFLGLYKILILVFNLVPYVALVIVRKKQAAGT